MSYAPIREDDHRPDYVRDEPVKLGRRHQPGEIRLGFQESLPAVGHEVVHIGDGLSCHVLQGFPRFFPLRFMLPKLACDRFLGTRLNLRVDQKPGQIGDGHVRLCNLALDPRRLDPVCVQGLLGHGRDFIEHAIHILEHCAHRRLDSCQELVLANCRRVATRLHPMPLPPAATVIPVLSLGILALAAVIDAAAAGTEKVPGERPELGRVTGAFDGIRGKLRLHASEGFVVAYPQGFIAVDQVTAFIRPARHARSRASIQLEAPSQEPHFADYHGIRQNAPDRGETPITAEPRRHAPIPHAASDFLEPDRFRQVGIENEPNRFGFFGMNRQSLLAFGFDDPVPVWRRAPGPSALLVPLNQPLASPLRQDTAVVGGHNELDATRQRVRPFRDADDFDAVLFQVLHQHVRFRRTPEPIVLVDIEPLDFPGFRFLHQSEQLSPAAGRASRFGLIDEVLERFPSRTFTVFDLHGDARAVVLRVA